VASSGGLTVDVFLEHELDELDEDEVQRRRSCIASVEFEFDGQRRPKLEDWLGLGVMELSGTGTGGGATCTALEDPERKAKSSEAIEAVPGVESQLAYPLLNPLPYSSSLDSDWTDLNRCLLSISTEDFPASITSDKNSELEGAGQSGAKTQSTGFRCSRKFGLGGRETVCLMSKSMPIRREAEMAALESTALSSARQQISRRSTFPAVEVHEER
jgi:hypothetical protein